MSEVHLRLASEESRKTSPEIVYQLAESILSKLLAALDMEKAGKAIFEGTLKGRGSQDLGNVFERARLVVQYRNKSGRFLLLWGGGGGFKCFFISREGASLLLLSVSVHLFSPIFALT